MAQNPHARLLRAFLEEICENEVLRSDWTAKRVGATLAVGVSLALAGCSSNSTGGSWVAYGGPLVEHNCTDGIDDDGDGFIDCADADCRTDPSCQGTGGVGGTGGAETGGVATGGIGTLYGIPIMPAVETNCSDGVDNDGDNLVDCADPDCASSTNCQGTGGVGGLYAIPF